MPTIVGVRLGPAGKVFSFDAAGTDPEPGEVVIVSTERGEEIGEVSQGSEQIEADQLERKLKPVLRIANERDLEIARELREKEIEAMRRYRELVDEHGLDMKPVSVEALFDGRKIVFYFTAEERVDFRNLVKDLARELKVRIDMRQIGVRDEARLVGGLGHCGQQLCCVRFGGDFEPVSIRMAKAQDLPLNPLKISGLCGRLMCCLRYEYEAYKDFKSRAPKAGATIDTPKGDARVVSLDAPRETVTISTVDGRITVPLEKMECGGCQSGRPCKISAEALQSLEDKALDPFMSGLEPVTKDKKDEKDKGQERSKRRRRPKSRTQKSDSSGKSDRGQDGRSGASGESTKKSGQKNKQKSGRRGDGSQRAAPKSQSSGGQTSSQDPSRRRRRRRPRPDSGGDGGGSRSNG